MRRKAPTRDAAEGPGCFLELDRDAQEERRRDQNREGQRQRRVDEGETDDAVVETMLDEEHGERQRQERQREGARHQHQHPERVPASAEPCRRIAGRRADADRKRHGQARDEHGIEERRQNALVGGKEAQAAEIEARDERFRPARHRFRRVQRVDQEQVDRPEHPEQSKKTEAPTRKRPAFRSAGAAAAASVGATVAVMSAPPVQSRRSHRNSSVKAIEMPRITIA